MKNITLFDTEGNHTDLLPITFTRPVCELRVGINTIFEKWQRTLPGQYSILTLEYLKGKYIPCEPPEGTASLYIAGRLIPNPELAKAADLLNKGEILISETSGDILACCCDASTFSSIDFNSEPAVAPNTLKKIPYSGQYKSIDFLYHIFQYNGEEITADYKAITAGRIGQPLHPSCCILGNPYLEDGIPALFIEEGASVEATTINLKDGPVYIGKDAKVMEGSCLRGPFALCEGAKVNMCSKIYSDTTIGPLCKVGGEINNVVMLGHSNKAHDGYLGNAVIGEWCNIGAGTNASNLKNDYSKIRLWNYRRHTFMRTDLQFCGLIMGDHSKAGINCMFNTATVVGVGCNIHGSGFPRVFIPSFSEGSPTSGFSNVPLKKFFDIATRVMARRKLELTDADRRIFERVAEVASQFK